MAQILHSNKPENYFAAGQIILGLCFLACVIIIPEYFFSLDQGGVSNYGTERRTVWFFVAGFGAAALGTFLTALSLPKTIAERFRLRRELCLLAFLYLLVLVSTFSYKLNDSLQALHQLAAIALFIDMFFGAIWLHFFAVKDTSTKIAFYVFCLSFIAITLTFLGVLHILFAAQIACGIAFAYMLTHSIKILMQSSNSHN